MAVLATIREWKNSFASINRIPLDVLSLIPTHLPSQADHFRASFVCRHWRKTFLQCAELWSKLTLSKGEVYVRTLLKRAKGSQLVIQVGHIKNPNVTVGTMKLLSPLTNRIRDLEFTHHNWAGIQKFMEINHGPFPLLDSLTFNITRDAGHSASNMTRPPFTHPFNTAINLRKFLFHSDSTASPSLSHFVFPNLVVFEFTTWELDLAVLLDFLEASPMLQTVGMTLVTDISLDGIPQGRVVILPNVESLNIFVYDDGPSYEIMARISCPSITSTSLAPEGNEEYINTEKIFPTLALWNTIIQQYTRSPLEEVTLKLTGGVSCTLTLQSSDTTVIQLRIFVGVYLHNGSAEVERDVLTKATSTILNHPQLANVKRFRICHDYDCLSSTPTLHVTNEVRRLFRFLGPLDELTIYHSDIQPYFDSFRNTPEGHTEEPVIFSPIKDLTISHPTMTRLSDGAGTTAIVGLAQARHALGVPFERVIIRALWMPEGVEEGLRPWVGHVEYRYADHKDDY